MVNLRSIFLLLLCMICFALQGQETFDEECGTKYSRDPNFDHSILEKWRLENADKNGFDPIVLPINFRIVRFSDGGGGLDPELIPSILDTLNARFNGTNIQFEQCGTPDFVDEGLFYNFDRSLYADSLITFNIPNVINVYLINKVLRENDDQICGYASFPWVDEEYIVVQNDCAQNGSTLAHELGHYFGLWHTHQVTDGIPEAVNGSNCAIAGDELCDTPADPRLSGSNVTSECVYTGSGKDLNGDSYQPDVTNIMSYSRKACRNYFSPLQMERMRFYLDTSRDYLLCSTTTSTRNHPDQNSVVNSLTISPNPLNNVLNLELIALKSAAVSIQIITIDGKILQSSEHYLRKDFNQISRDVSGLPKGVFIIHIFNNESSLTRRIVKL